MFDYADWCLHSQLADCLWPPHTFVTPTDPARPFHLPLGLLCQVNTKNTCRPPLPFVDIGRRGQSTPDTLLYTPLTPVAHCCSRLSNSV